MNASEIVAARRAGSSFSELARISGEPEIEVRKIYKMNLDDTKTARTRLAKSGVVKPAKLAIVREIEDNTGDEVATEINGLLKGLNGDMLSASRKAVRVGELLTDQKAKLTHGGWSLWLKANVKLSLTMVRYFMRCYRNRDLLNQRSGADLTIKGLANGGKIKASEPKPPKLTKPLVVKKAIGSSTATISDPPKNWHVIPRAGHEGRDAYVVCTKCWTYFGAAAPLGSVAHSYECECPDGRRNAALAKEDK